MPVLTPMDPTIRHILQKTNNMCAAHGAAFREYRRNEKLELERNYDNDNKNLLTIRNTKGDKRLANV